METLKLEGRFKQVWKYLPKPFQGSSKAVDGNTPKHKVLVTKTPKTESQGFRHEITESSYKVLIMKLLK